MKSARLCSIATAAGPPEARSGGLLSPTIAALAMSLSAVSAIGNALRLRQARLATPA
jgi:Cu+-exporting ATPase